MDSTTVPLTSNLHAKADALVLHTRSTPSVILSCAKAGLRVAIFAVPISNRALQACTTEPRFSVERELHPTLTSQEYKPMISNSSAPGSKPALTNLELAEPRGFSFLRHCSLTLTAVLVDAAFFFKRAARIYGHQTPEAAAKQLHRGLDIASLAYKDQINQLVLISGDSDFVPAAKLARREGIDFVLDPMWSAIRPDLHEHIDGLKSTCPRPDH